MSLIIKGLSPEWWTPPSQEEETDPVEVKLVPLSAPQMADVSLHFKAQVGVQAPGLIMAARYGVVDWKNVSNEKGKVLRATPANIERLPFELLCEIGAHVVNLNALEDDEIKNS
jgi:hypothetical protein